METSGGDKRDTSSGLPASVIGAESVNCIYCDHEVMKVSLRHNEHVQLVKSIIAGTTLDIWSPHNKSWFRGVATESLDNGLWLVKNCDDCWKKLNLPATT